MRYKFIDALRGIAAIAVLLTHVATPLGQWVRWGALGVPVFFVISGFVIAASNADQNITLRYTGRFILRRSLRLDPPYWLTICLMLAYFHTPLSAGAVLANMFYLHVLLRQPNAISVGWTLCQEVQLYLFFIVTIGLIQQLARIAKRDYLIIAMIAQAVLAVISMKLAGHFCGGWFLPYWYQFFAGVLCFWIASGRLAWQYILAYVALISLIAIALQSGGDELTRPAAVTVALVALTLIAARNALTTFLAGSVWQFLGRISYSLYLTHIPVNDILRQWIRPGYGLMLVSIPTCLAAATLMYLLVERTAIGWSKSISKKPDPPADNRTAAALSV